MTRAIVTDGIVGTIDRRVKVRADVQVNSFVRRGGWRGDRIAFMNQTGVIRTVTTRAHFADRLHAAIAAKGTPICVGIDPVYERLPESVRGDDADRGHVNAEAAIEAIYRFVRGVLQAVAEHVPCVKIQSACFERFHWEGVEAYTRLIQEAQEMGLLVIADAKRGDIGISAEHYAAGLLSESRFADLGTINGPDAITVNPYLGPDTLEPFVRVAQAQGKGLFALVRTSNPGSDAVQGVRLADGSTVAEMIGKAVASTGDHVELVGKCGYSLLGAVVGATKSQDVQNLRKIMPQQIFLVPGFGAQGGTADDVRACFDASGKGAIITASRSILFAYEKPKTSDWTGAIEQATVEMKKQIHAILHV
jgi:orotidine-5'-phosphate decarboxylase